MSIEPSENSENETIKASFKFKVEKTCGVDSLIEINSDDCLRVHRDLSVREYPILLDWREILTHFSTTGI